MVKRYQIMGVCMDVEAEMRHLHKPLPSDELMHYITTYTALALDNVLNGDPHEYGDPTPYSESHMEYYHGSDDE